MFGEWQDFFRTSVSSRGVCAAKVGHSLLSSVYTLLLLFSLSVQQSFSAWTPMLRFATKELCGCQIAFSYGHQTRSRLWVSSVGMSMGVQKDNNLLFFILQVSLSLHVTLCTLPSLLHNHYFACHAILSQSTDSLFCLEFVDITSLAKYYRSCRIWTNQNTRGWVQGKTKIEGLWTA